MARKTGTGRPRRRNPLVPALRKLGRGMVHSAKLYKRRPKHRAQKNLESDQS